jgi:hypothetical protein
VGVPPDDINADRAAATSGDDDHSLQVTMRWVAVASRAGIARATRPNCATVETERGPSMDHKMGDARPRQPTPEPTTGDNHLCPEDPTAGRGPALGEPTHRALFRVIAGSPGTPEFRHRRLPLILDDAAIAYLS